MENTTNDTLTCEGIAKFDIRYNGNTGANLFVEVTGIYGFSNAMIYARDANLFNIYCHQEGDLTMLRLNVRRII